MLSQVNNAEPSIGQFLNEMVLVFDISFIGVNEPAAFRFSSFYHFNI